jgi:hypothetical protein
MHSNNAAAHYILLVPRCKSSVEPAETLIPIYQTTWCHTPENSNLHSHRCRNLKSHLILMVMKSNIKCSWTTTWH